MNAEVTGIAAVAVSAAPQTMHCRNCNFDLSTVSSAKFCPECGQDTDRTPPTFREFVQHFFGNYVSVKGSFLQTIWRLISRPGALTKDYLEGRKRAYVLPFRLYLTVSVISFLVFGLLAGQSMRGAASNDAKIDPKAFESGNVLSFGDSRQIRFDKGKIECVNMPGILCSQAKKKFGSTEVFKQFIESLPERMVRYWAYAMFALVPLFAALLKLSYVRRRMTYGSHIVFALHLHAFWLLAVLASLAHEYAVAIATFAIPVYAILALRRVYGGGWIKTLIKALIISLLYLIAASIAVAIVAVVALLF